MVLRHHHDVAVLGCHRPGDGEGVVGARIVDDDHLQALVGLGEQRSERGGDGVGGVERRHDHRHERAVLTVGQRRPVDGESERRRHGLRRVHGCRTTGDEHLIEQVEPLTSGGRLDVAEVRQVELEVRVVGPAVDPLLEPVNRVLGTSTALVDERRHHGVVEHVVVEEETAPQVCFVDVVAVEMPDRHLVSGSGAVTWFDRVVDSHGLQFPKGVDHQPRPQGVAEPHSVPHVLARAGGRRVACNDRRQPFDGGSCGEAASNATGHAARHGAGLHGENPTPTPVVLCSPSGRCDRLRPTVSRWHVDERRRGDQGRSGSRLPDRAAPSRFVDPACGSSDPSANPGRDRPRCRHTAAPRPGRPHHVADGQVSDRVRRASGGRLPIAADEIVLVVGRVPQDLDGTVHYDPARVDAHLVAALGQRALWAPVSPVVREHLRPAADSAEILLTADDWVEIIDPEPWTVDRTDTVDPERPVIGRHSRPSRTKWPATADDLLAAYPDDGSVRVRVLGGVEGVREVLGREPRGWEILPFGAMSASEFLAGIDVFVYYHHPDLVEAFGRTVLEALASGAVVVLPPHFEPLFGSACLYADPEGVAPIVERLYADPVARREQSQLGLRELRRRFSHDAHVRRIADLIGPPGTKKRRPLPAPDADAIPRRQRAELPTVLVAALGASVDEVEAAVEALAAQRAYAGGFVPVIATTERPPASAAAAGIQVEVITSRRNWRETPERWPEYAAGRLRLIVRSTVPAA